MHLSASYHVARAAEVPPSVRQPLSMSGRLREALGAPSNPRLRSLRPDPRAAPRAALSAPHSDPCPHRAPPTRQNNARPTPHPERTARRARHPPPHSNLRPRTRRPPASWLLRIPLRHRRRVRNAPTGIALGWAASPRRAPIASDQPSLAKDATAAFPPYRRAPLSRATSSASSTSRSRSATIRSTSSCWECTSSLR